MRALVFFFLIAFMAVFAMAYDAPTRTLVNHSLTTEYTPLVRTLTNFSLTEGPGPAPDLNYTLWNGTAWIDAYSVYMEFRCTASQTDCEPTNQDAGSSQSIHQVCNNGTAAASIVEYYLSATCANITLECDDDYTVAGATSISTSPQSIHGSLAVGACSPISCWADYSNPLSGCYFDTYVNATA